MYRLYLEDILFSLVRVRNPWGDNNEWKGKWSDHDPNWKNVDTDTKYRIGLQHKADGEFWMDFFTDFIKEFEEISICTMGPDFDFDGQVDDVSCTLQLKGEWKPNFNAGGSRNNFTLFATNPKYKLTVMSESDQMIISLAQRKIPWEKLHQIGFTIYPAGDKGKKYDADYFNSSKAVATSGNYINYREVFGRFTLPKGTFIIIPATFIPQTPAEYLLRIFSQEKITLEELK